MKRFLAGVLVAFLVFGYVTMLAYGAVGTDYVTQQVMIDNMSNQERNEYITQIKNSTTNSRAAPLQMLKLAWYAAAQVAETYYPNAAMLVQYSVWGVDYTEVNGPISAAIRNSSEYRQWAIYCQEPVIEFESGDLFYAIHGSPIVLRGHSSAGGEIHLSDTYDFAFDSNYDPEEDGLSFWDVFNTLINDWGWLSLQMHALEEIGVSITFTDGLIGTYATIGNEEAY